MKKPSLKSLQVKIWAECKRIIHTRYKAKCYTCDKVIAGKNRHTGHMFPKKFCKAYMKYDLRNLRPQCYHDNMNLGGMGAIFIERMRKKEGDKYVDGIIKDLKKVVDPEEHYVLLLEQYKLIKK